MTNHIEQMMKAAGVKQKFRYIVLFFNNEYEARREDMPIYFKASCPGTVPRKGKPGLPVCAGGLALSCSPYRCAG